MKKIFGLFCLLWCGVCFAPGALVERCDGLAGVAHEAAVVTQDVLAIAKHEVVVVVDPT
jgi:hypothetical protein